MRDGNARLGSLDFCGSGIGGGPGGGGGTDADGLAGIYCGGTGEGLRLPARELVKLSDGVSATRRDSLPLALRYVWRAYESGTFVLTLRRPDGAAAFGSGRRLATRGIYAGCVWGGHRWGRCTSNEVHSGR